MLNELDFNNIFNVNKVRKFLEKNKNSDYMQSVEWNIIRNENKKYFLFYSENGQILWTCNLLEKSKDGINFLYAPRGPVLKDSNILLLNKFLKEIKKWMNDRHYSKIILNPYLKYDDLNRISHEYKYSVADKNDFSNLMDSCKLAIMDIIYNEDDMINKINSKHRQNTRRSYRKNLNSKITTSVDLKNFYNLYLQTSKRHDFIPHDINYFKKLIEVYKNNLIFLEVWHGNKPLAMSIDIVYNNKLIYLYGVSSSENRNLLGMYNLQWEAIKYCIRNHIPKYDFGGVFCEENDIESKDFGLFNFKKGYCYNGFINIVPDLIFELGSDYSD